MTTSTSSRRSQAAARRPHRALRSLAVVAAWVGLWWAVAARVGQELLVPTPAQVAVRLAGLVPDPAFWAAVGASLARILAGFAAGVAVGVALAVLTSASSLALEALRPVMSLVRSTPVASFIVLALIWFTTSQVPVLTAFLMVVPVVWENVSAGIRATDPRLLQMAAAFALPRRTVVSRVRLPAVLPYLLAACTTGIGLAWKAGTAAEVLGVPRHAIGTRLYEAKIYLDTPEVFAWTAVVVVLSIALERGFARLTARLTPGGAPSLPGSAPHPASPAPRPPSPASRAGSAPVSHPAPGRLP